jgi:hypothetical protein
MQTARRLALCLTALWVFGPLSFQSASSAKQPPVGARSAAASSELRAGPRVTRPIFVSPVAFPSAATTGVPLNWVPKQTTTSDLRVRTRGAVIQDVRLINADLLIEAENVIVRRVELRGGDIVNSFGSTCSNGLVLENVSIVRGPGQVTTTQDQAAIREGGYTARRVKIDGRPEGFRVGGRHEGCRQVVIEDSFVRATPPDVCNDWHGDALQGYDGSHLIVRNVTLQLVNIPTCGGTAPFFYPHSQENTSVDIHRLLVMGGGYPFRLGMRGPVRGLRIVSNSWEYGPIDVKCSVVTAWEAQIVLINAGFLPTRIVRQQPCNTESGN